MLNKLRACNDTEKANELEMYMKKAKLQGLASYKTRNGNGNEMK